MKFIKKRLWKSICACSFLERYTRDPVVPVAHNERDGYAYLISENNEELKIRYCFGCGGNKSGLFSDSLEKCSCNYVSELLQKNTFPIEYNEDFHEYYIMSDQVNTSMIDDKEFNKVVEGKIRFAWVHRDFDGALAEIEAVIDEVTPEMKAHCLLLSGQIKDDQGLSSDAREDWLAAIPYSRAGSFGRHCLEREIGSSYEKAGQRIEALGFYRSAIQTCVEAVEFAGIKALTAFLALNNGRIPSEDEAMVAAAVEKSWRVLELQGEPDLNNLSNAVTKLAEGFSEKVRQAKEG